MCQASFRIYRTNGGNGISEGLRPVSRANSFKTYCLSSIITKNRMTLTQNKPIRISLLVRGKKKPSYLHLDKTTKLCPSK